MVLVYVSRRSAMFFGGIVVLCFLGFVPCTTTASSASTGANELVEDAATSSTPELVRMSYQDLQDVFGDNVDEQQQPSRSRSDDLIQAIGQAFGTHGLGIVEVTDMPNEIVKLRERLLPYARHLAHLPQDQLREIEFPEQYYNIGWSHGREQLSTGEYDLSKGSFYIDPFRNPTTTNEKSDVDAGDVNGSATTAVSDSANVNVYPPALQPELEDMLLQMTHFMAKVGEWVLKLCDAYLAQQQRQEETEVDQVSDYNDGLKQYKSLVDTLGSNVNSKARLLHYFPKSTSKNVENTSSTSGDWCGWHTDHGSLTALLPGMVTNEETGLEDVCTPNTNVGDDSTGIEQDEANEEDYEFPPGLYILPRQPPPSLSSESAATADSNDNLVHVQLAPTSLGFQIGETISIMSNGLLQATPHAVLSGRSRRREQMEVNQKLKSPKVLSRQSLALFLQPKPDEPLPPLATESNQELVDPKSLEARWRPTFGEFHHATMKAYN